jgi:hypothetical protein
MREWTVAVLLSLAAAGCASAEDETQSAKRRCTALRDHLIDVQLESASGNRVDLKQHREALQQALGDDFVEHCQDRPVAEVKCALAAKDSSSVAACSSSQ